MIHVNYSMTQKEHKKIYLQVMTMSYMKIYFIVLSLGVIVTKLLGLLFKSEGLNNTATSLFITFIPTLILCLGLSIFVSYLDYKKVIKTNVTEGNFKIRFDKKMFIWQTNGENNKLSYKGFIARKGFKNTVILNNPGSYCIVIPANLITNEQYITIKEAIRG